MSDPRQGIVYIGEYNSRRQFIPKGTGFMIFHEKPVIVTCHHLLLPEYNCAVQEEDDVLVSVIFAKQYSREPKENDRHYFTARVVPSLSKAKEDLAILEPLADTYRGDAPPWLEAHCFDLIKADSTIHKSFTLYGYKAANSPDMNSLQVVGGKLGADEYPAEGIRHFDLYDHKGELTFGFSGSPVLVDDKCVGIYRGAGSFEPDKNQRISLPGGEKATIETRSTKAICVSVLHRLLGISPQTDAKPRRRRYPEFLIRNISRDKALQKPFHTFRTQNPSGHRPGNPESRIPVKLHYYWGLNRGAFIGFCCGAAGLYQSLLFIEHEFAVSKFATSYARRWWLRLKPSDLEQEYFARLSNLVSSDEFFSEEVEQMKERLPEQVVLGLIIEGNMDSFSQITRFYQKVLGILGDNRHPLAIIVSLSDEDTPESRRTLEQLQRQSAEPAHFNPMLHTVELNFFLPFETPDAGKPGSQPDNSDHFWDQLFQNIETNAGNRLSEKYKQLDSHRKLYPAGYGLEVQSQDPMAVVDQHVKKSQSTTFDQELLECTAEFVRERLLELLLKYSKSERIAARNLALKFSTRYPGYTWQYLEHIIKEGLRAPSPREIGPWPDMRENVCDIFAAILHLADHYHTDLKFQEIYQNFAILMESDELRLFDVQSGTNRDISFLPNLQPRACKIAGLAQFALPADHIPAFLQYLPRNQALVSLAFQQEIHIDQILNAPLEIRKFFSLWQTNEWAKYAREQPTLKAVSATTNNQGYMTEESDCIPYSIEIRKKLIDHYEF